MLKRFKTIRKGLQGLVLCETHSLYKDDKAAFVRGPLLDDR